MASREREQRLYSRFGGRPPRGARRSIVEGMVCLTVWLCLATSAVADVFVVDTTVDEVDGSCGDGDCSLRDAILVSNTDTAVDEIVLSAATYQLTLGQLTVQQPVLVRGVDHEQTVIEQTTSGARVLEATNFLGELELRDLAIVGGSINNPTTSDDLGAGVRTASTSARFVGVRFEGNQVIDQARGDAPAGGGGGFATLSSRVEVIGCLFVDNWASDGAQLATESDTVMRDTELRGGSGSNAVSLLLGSGRTAEFSGVTDASGTPFGINLNLFGDARVDVRNSTLTKGLSVFGDSQASLWMVHTTVVGTTTLSTGAPEILLERTVLDGPCNAFGGPITSLGFNVETTASCLQSPQPTDLQNVDPADLFLGPLEDNGGLTDTFRIESFVSVLPGQELSGCRTTFDQRGVSRNFCDIGAFELGVCVTPSAPVAIPDDDPTGVSLLISDLLAAGNDLDVFLDIEHTWVGDLIVTLEGPGGAQVDLINQPGSAGCNGNDVRTFFDDEALLDGDGDCRAANGLEAYQRARYQPLESLSTFDGLQGAWTLHVSDNAAQDTGAIRRVCLYPQRSLLFYDSLETGDTTRWSSTVP